jgi:butyryl-CoA dehydrogenase
MASYTAPLADFRFVLDAFLDIDSHLEQLFPPEQVSRDLIDSVLEEAARFAETELVPLNAVGDIEGCTLLSDGSVRTPSGFKQAYARLAAGGWLGLGASAEHGGTPMPVFVNLLVSEIFAAANISFADYVGLSMSGANLIQRSAPAPLRASYVPRIIRGEWAATMCMTEPHCGTDIGLLRTRATPRTDGTFGISGTKIFISGGDHDLTDNIAHLVLARLSDAPPGVKGVSLFLVPKFLPLSDGNLGTRNAVHALRIEHKMGYAGSATCQMEFANATGWLLGEPNRGLRELFPMINETRLLVALQGTATTEAAYQIASRYAQERLQGRAPGGARYPDRPADPLIVHPDVRRMLLAARAFVEGSRALVAWIGLQLDIARCHPHDPVRKRAQRQVAMLVPVVKATFTDLGFESCNLCLQVLGGHGYVRDNGIEQLVRDVRIAPIQEGANAVQALDLVFRKLAGDPAAFRDLLAMIEGELAKARACREIADLSECVQRLTPLLSDAAARLIAQAANAPDVAACGATDFQRAFGLYVLAWAWVRLAHAACIRHTDNRRAKLVLARFFIERMLPHATVHLANTRADAATILEWEGA